MGDEHVVIDVSPHDPERESLPHLMGRQLRWHHLAGVIQDRETKPPRPCLFLGQVDTCGKEQVMGASKNAATLSLIGALSLVSYAAQSAPLTGLSAAAKTGANL
jgi:hypothetical protein